MSLHQLEVEPRDICAQALGLLLDAPAPTPLAELAIPDGDGGLLTLGVLAASHVITATRPGHRLVEQVSCDALACGGQQLPERLDTDSYRITSSTRTVPRTQFDELARHLRGQAQHSPGWVCGAFPGADTAVTAMTGSPLTGGGWSWQSWHLYPGHDSGVVVETRSRWQP